MSNHLTQMGISRISVEKVFKVFGAVRALCGISLTMKAGESVAIMGANGAGKSTLLELLALSAKPTRGKILFDDRPPEGDVYRHRIGLLSHEPMLYPDLTAEENLLLFARFFGKQIEAETMVQEAVASFSLSSFADDRPCRVLSRGQLQRVALARTLLGEPALLLLDEPASGLDGQTVSRIERVVAAHAEKGGITMVVTHDPEVAFRIASRMVLLKRGRVVTNETAPKTAAGWRDGYLEAVEGGA